MAKIDEHIKVMMLKGETGASIKSIDRTDRTGLVDTYTVTLTDGRKSNFIVTNGSGFNTFEIGGRNLLRGSKDFSGAGFRVSGATYSAEKVSGADCTVMSFDNSAASADSSVAQWDVPGIGTAGTVYTLSFWFKGSGGCCVYFNGPEGHTQVSEAEVTINGDSKKSASPLGEVFFMEPGSTVSGWTHCTVVYTLGSQSGSTTTKYVLWRANAGAKLSIALPMLERSTKPSDWTPAPEDKADVSALAGKADASALAGKADASALADATVVKTLTTGTVTLCGVTYKVSAIACGKVVHLFAKLVSGTLVVPGGTTVHSDVSIKIPEGYRHMEDEFNEIYISGWCDAQKSVTLGFYLIRTGEVYLACSSYGTLQDAHAVSFSATYIAE